MEFLPDSIGQQPLSQLRDSISEWNVYLPSGQDRDRYIQSCYQTSTVSLTNFNGEVVHRVPIGVQQLQQVRFPTDKTDLGSLVICTTAPYSGKLNVVSVYSASTEYVNQQEHQYRFSKVTVAGSAELLVDGNGRLVLSVDHELDGGELTIQVTNKQGTGKLKVIVNGEVSVYASGAVQVQGASVEATVWDGQADSEKTQAIVTDGKVQVITNLLEVGRQDLQPMLLGQATVDLLTDLLDQLGQESAGPYPLLGNATYIQLKQRLEDLKSKVSSTQ